MTLAQLRHRRKYDTRRREGRCFTCGDALTPERRGRVRCLECARIASAKQRDRNRSVATRHCGRCDEPGHDRRTCMAAD